MKTVVHLVRHGEVYNPTAVLYGRRPGYHLSDLGHQMAKRVAEVVADRDITGVWASPLERAQETAQPIAAALGLDVRTDERVIESSSKFEGKTFGQGEGALLNPKAWRHLWNPWRPSWGEPYKEVVARMLPAIHDARDAVRGHEAVIVSHQLPIWITRLHLEDRSFLHDPRRRHCTLCSLTSLTFDDDDLRTVTYSEPAGDLIPVHARKSPFSAGGATETATPEEDDGESPGGGAPR
jgi:broad specificity phosphatase PhoE